MEDNHCESFEPFAFEPLDLPHISTDGDEKLESSKSITLESSNFTTELVSSPIPASVPQFSTVS